MSSMSSAISRSGASQIMKHTAARPIKSNNVAEAKRGVRWIYKECTFQVFGDREQRALPKIWQDNQFYQLPLPHMRLLIKNQFLKNRAVTDPRIIDRLVAEAEVHLSETKRHIYNWDHLKNHLLKENLEAKPTDFLSKFFAGKT